MTELEKKKLLEQRGAPQTQASMPTAAAPTAVGNYNPGQNVQDAYQQYLKQMQAQPGAANSQLQGQMDNLYNQISTRQPFKYDMNADRLYQQMKDQYARSGQLGMMNSMGQASALTGGYANAWAQTAGQQTYDSYMQELNNNLPALEDRAYGRYQDEGNQLAQRFSMAGQLTDRDYGQYRDRVGDWQYGTSQALDMYSNERNFDYGAYVDQTNWDRQDAQRAEDWQRQLQLRDEEWARQDAQAAAAAARRGGGGGGGKESKTKTLLPEHEFLAADMLNSGGLNAVDNYFDKLNKDGYDPLELYNAREKIIFNKQAFAPRKKGIGK